jgi:hypothetical protein
MQTSNDGRHPISADLFGRQVDMLRPGSSRSRSVAMRVWVAAALLGAGLFFSPGAAPVVVASKDPTIAAAGDISCDPTDPNFNGGIGTATSCRQADVSNLLAKGGFASVLALGDNQYYCGGLAAYQQVYDPTWGRVKSITHPVPGNHEYLTSGGTGCDSSNLNGAGYFGYFGSAAGTPGQGYYSFDVGAWHLIALNSNCSEAGGCVPSSPQGMWLAADLAAHPKQCLLAYWHIPLFSSGGRASPGTLPLWQQLYGAHADVVLDGHDHIYERFDPQTPAGLLDPTNGIRQFTVGTGGSDHTSIASLAPNSVVDNTDSFGVLALTLHQASYDWAFEPAVGSFTDSGSATCHTAVAGPTPTPGSSPTVPGKPTGVAATPEVASALVSWFAPSSNGGASINRYTVTSSGGQTCSTTGALSCIVTGLTNGVGYTFTVAAANSVGTGPPSSASSSVVPANPPNSPTAVMATPGNASAIVSWAAPASDGGSAITRYTAFSSPDGLTCSTTGALGCTAVGLTNGQAYTFTVAASNDVGAGPPSAPSGPVIPVASATYHALTPPVRLLDTRIGNGLTGRLVANTPASFDVTSAGRPGSPVPAGATAVTGNLTVTAASSSWSVFLGPIPEAQPTSSTINFAAGETTANGLTVALGSGGTLSATYMSSAGNTTDLVFDVTGYFTPDTTGATYHPMTPVRMLDTRVGNGLSQKLDANTPVTFFVTSQNRAGSTVPAGATAVTGNVTVTDETSSWAVYVGPTPLATPGTSTLNFTAGEIQANNLTVALGPDGSLSATYLSAAGNTTDLVFDVTGYYTPDLTGAQYVPVTPVRLLDTRVGNGLAQPLVAGTPATYYVTSQNRPGSPIPADATAVSGNVTVVHETNSWAVFLGPDPTSDPGTSTLNFNKGDIKANGLTVALGPGGGLSPTYLSTPGNTTDLVFDVTGYYVP